ncbi:MAG: hypothetical protein ACLRWP_10930 [Bilophila wadsworthia]
MSGANSHSAGLPNGSASPLPRISRRSPDHAGHQGQRQPFLA